MSDNTTVNTVNTVRIGFVGVGGMGQMAHLRNYGTIPGCQVVAIAELREKTAQRVAQRYNVPRVYHDHTEMLAQEKLDGIVCTQPFTRHGILVPELLKVGIPLLTEKPLAGSLQVGERLVQAMRESGTWHMVAYHKRSDPATQFAKIEIERLKQTGELGHMRYVRITMPPGDWVAGGFNELINEGDPTPQLDFDPPASDLDAKGNADYIRFVNYYIHQVNLMRHLLGEPYRVTFADPHEVLLVGESASGITCTLEMAPYSTTHDWHEVALVCFERGYVKLELPAPVALNRPGRVEIFSDPGPNTTPKFITPQLPWVHAHRQQAINFVRAIKGDAPPPCDAIEALEDLKIAREYLRLLRGV
jgi:predicted dehydrogenase